MKFIVIAVLGFILIVTPVLAQSEKKEDNSSNKQEKSQNSSSSSDKEKKDDTSQTPENCDPNFAWKNHGEYVACVAKLKLGGQSVPEAAKSDIGKSNQILTPTPSLVISPTPDSSDSASPSAIIVPSPEITEPTGLIPTITDNLVSVQESIDTVVDQFAALIDFLNPFN